MAASSSYFSHKRIGNLYNDINKELRSPKDEGYQNRLEAAYKRFSSKLRKINYEIFLQLHAEILKHISKNKQYYGVNMYRFERLLRLYNIMEEVDSLLACKDESAERDILRRSIILIDIQFPKVYQSFSVINSAELMSNMAESFSFLYRKVATLSMLVLDYFVEKGRLGDEWEKLLLDTVNEMTEKVFYDPTKIDFKDKPGTQEIFEKVLDAPIRDMVFNTLL
jgi:hypothetical protein